MRLSSMWKKRSTRKGSAHVQRNASRTFRPRLERLEDRLAPSVFTVLNTDDGGPDSLRQAILDANANPGLDTIAFAIGAGVQTIAPQSDLPWITDPVTLDATTQPGFAGTPIIELDGGAAGTRVFGLTLTVGGSTVRGMVINRFDYGEIKITGAGASGNLVAGNYIGTDVSGSIPLGDMVSGTGVYIDAGANHNTVGGTSPADRNVIGGNVQGVFFDGHGTDANAVLGNYIGTNAAGTAPVGNLVGILTYSGPDGIVIGGSTPGSGNLISGNSSDGIQLNSVTNARIRGNLIGTDASGTAWLSTGNSIVLYNTTGTVIGGSGAGDRNVIAGLVRGGPNDGATISANYIGLDVTGLHQLGNGGGIIDLNGHNILIGGDRPETRNVIVGISGYYTIACGGDPGDGNRIQGNYIGTDYTGLHALGDAGDGIVLYPGWTVGGSGAGEGNVIGGFSSAGITGGYSNDVIQGNLIGLGADGSTVIPNMIGIVSEGGFIIGGSAPGAGNVISGNIDSAIRISYDGVIQGNLIGTDATGTLARPNGNEDNPNLGFGIYVEKNNLVGGTAPGEGNVISGNAQGGVQITDYWYGGGVAVASNNRVQGNIIGLNKAGNAAIPNGGPGVLLYRSGYRGPLEDNVIGGTTPASRNIISGNLASGVLLVGDGVSGTQIEGNFIGTDATGNFAIGNAEGIRIAGFPSNNIIGGTAPGAGNLIRGNAGCSVTVYANFTQLAVGNQIRGNAIYGNGDIGIDLGDNGVTPNDLGDADTGPNMLQNYPVLTQAVGGTTTTVQGTLNSTPNTAFTLDFYASAVADRSGYGEGERYLGFIYVTTDGSGNAAYTATLLAATAVGEFITTTATDPDGNTSEFSAVANVTIVNHPPTANAGGPYAIAYGGSVTLDASASSDPDGDPLTYSWTVNGHAGAAGGVHPTLSWSQLVALGIAGVGSFPLGVAVGDGYYAPVNSAPATLLATPAPTSTTVSASFATPLAGVDTVTFTATVTETVPNVTLGGSVDFVDVTAGTDLGVVPLVNGTAAVSASFLTAGGHTITAAYSGMANFGSSHGSTSVTVIPPASLSGLVWEDFNDDGQVDFGEKGIAGVAVALTGTDDLGHAVSRGLTTDADGAYVFLNLRPGSYKITETQPAGYLQGIDSVGTAGGSLIATDQFFVALAQGVNSLNYNYGERPAAGGAVRKGQTATIGFWNNKNGQALIKSFNGGAASTQLANWLAATLPHIFGANAGGNNLIGKSNAAVAALFQQDFLLKGVKLDAQVLATALSVYATNATLDSTKVAAQYGFTVSGDGVGTATVNVGGNGDAFGVANNTVLTVLDLLQATDAQAVNGVLYNGNTTKRNAANSVYGAVNEAGGI